MKFYSKLILATSFLLLLAGVSVVGAHEDGAHGAEADIVDTAIAADDFNTLVTAVQAAGLVETLKGDGPFTVFAPTDAAFAALPEGTLDALLADKDKLTAVLTYHVVAKKVPSAAITGPLNVATVQGDELAVTIESGVQINDATVVKADIMTSNGVIHVIDKVLVPAGVL